MIKRRYEISAVTKNTIPPTAISTTEHLTLRDCVEKTLHDYFAHLDGAQVNDVYNLVLREVEAPLFASVMQHVQGNQTRASEVLGLNRGTLRKKLKQYNLL